MWVEEQGCQRRRAAGSEDGSGAAASLSEVEWLARRRMGVESGAAVVPCWGGEGRCCDGLRLDGWDEEGRARGEEEEMSLWRR